MRMAEWLKDLLVAIGGGTVVVIGILTVCKNLLVTFHEKRLEANFGKKLTKFNNQIERSTTAYKKLLDREMVFYEKTDHIISELIPLVQDFQYYSTPNEFQGYSSAFEAYRTHIIRYIDLTKELKSELLIHQVYVPKDIFSIYSDVVKSMQDAVLLWSNIGEQLHNNQYDSIDYSKSKEAEDTLLMKYAVAECKVRERIEQLANV